MRREFGARKAHGFRYRSALEGTHGGAPPRRRAPYAMHGVGAFCVGVLAVAGTAVAGPTRSAKPEASAPAADADLRATARRADAVFLATVEDPATRQRPVHTGQGPDFVRLQWRLHEVAWVAGARSLPAALLLDEHDWRGDLSAWTRCRGDAGCADRRKPAHGTQLTRPPRAGQRVLVFARLTHDGWELAAERAFDAPARAEAAARAWSQR